MTTGARTDLPWLRRVARPAPAPRIDTTHHGVRPDARPAAAAPSTRIDVVHHDAHPPAQNPVGAGLLDLSSGPSAPTPTPPPARRARVREVPRARTGQPPRLLTPGAPTVTLTRLQTGVGLLRVELVASAAVGDVRLGAAVELQDRRSSAVFEGGPHDAWPSPRPVLRLVRERYAALLVDLRQAPALRRLAVFGASASGGPLTWGGTLVVTTFAGARVEAPLDLGTATGGAVLLSVHAVDGEWVLRAEADPVGGSVRDLCLAYGYQRITWADDRTPAG